MCVVGLGCCDVCEAFAPYGVVEGPSGSVWVVVGVGLVAGKLVGVFSSTYLLARFTGATLDEDLSWWDVLGMALLAGVGFTVSLLIGELAFPAGSAREDHVKVAVLLGSLASVLLATVVLRRRNRVYRRVAERESADFDHDGIPDIYQHPGSDRP